MRVRFFVDGLAVADGFNVYLGLRQAVRDRSRQPGQGASTVGAKWFDLPRYCLPYGRSHDELRRLADVHRRASLKQCFAFQLPDPFVTAGGHIIAKPAAW